MSHRCPRRALPPAGGDDRSGARLLAQCARLVRDPRKVAFLAGSGISVVQRAALDVLDKIAVALNEYLAVCLDTKGIYFHTFWRAKLDAAWWRPKLAEAIRQDNHALVALSEIAADLSDGPAKDGSLSGLLNPARRARHAGTHRFVVLHDMGDSRDSAAIEHHDLGEFQATALRTVRLSRAALLHFLEAVTYRESAGHGMACPST